MNMIDHIPQGIAFRALNSDDLRRCAPSIFAGTARPGVSPRYTFVSTAQVVDLLGGEGWEPALARQQRARMPDRQGFQMHEVRFARKDDIGGGFRVGECRPEMILQNAHDGTRAYRIDAGLYRLVCRNGLVVADAAFAHVAIRHMDVSAEKFAEAARSVAENTPRVLEVIARWQSVELTDPARHEFARRAIELRWGAGDPVGQAISPGTLLSPVRYGDDRRDLWTTYNLVQEHVVRGGDRYLGTTRGGSVRRNTTRPIGGLTAAQCVNKGLWSLAEEFSGN